MSELLVAAQALLEAVLREEADEYMRQEVMDLQYTIFRAEAAIAKAEGKE